MLAYSIKNNVKTTLASGVTAADSTINISAASAPNNNPRITTTAPSRFTIVDNEVSPTKIEIIEAATVTIDGGGGFVLGGVTRGREGTAAQIWSGGATIFQSITAEMANGSNFGLHALLDETQPEDDFGVPHRYFIRAQADTLIQPLSQDERLDIRADRISVESLQCNGGTITGHMVGAPGATMNFQGGAIFSGLTSGNLRVTGSVPANSSSSVPNAGVIRVDANYLYVSVGVNNWKRVALSAF